MQKDCRKKMLTVLFYIHKRFRSLSKRYLLIINLKLRCTKIQVLLVFTYSLKNTIIIEQLKIVEVPWMIKNVIFDIGNVMMGFDALNYGRTVFKDEAMAKRMQKALDEFKLWDKCDMGDRPVEDIIEEFATTMMVGEEEAAKKALYASIDFVEYRAGSVPWVKEIKAAGYKVYYLSNYNRYIMDKRPDVLEFVDYTDGGVFSCEVQLIKPQREMYECLLNKYNLKAEECIFLDDREANLKGGEAVGIQGLLVKTQEQARSDLRKLLGY